jgi:hypothetical protein
MLSKIKKVFVMFDTDAIKIARKLASTLSVFTKVEVIELESGDPDNMKEHEVHDLRRDLRL